MLFEFGFKDDGAGVSKAGVESGAVIEGLDVVEEGGAGLGEGSEALVVNHFVFEAAPEAFDEGVVVAIAWATHGRDQAMLGEDFSIGGAGELAAPIGVHDEVGARPALEKGHAQGGTDEASIEALMHGPTDHPPGANIEHGNQI